MAGSVLPIGLARRPTVTKDRILDAAESLFMEHGFEATSLRAITAAAGVNLASVNYHFGSKEELFQAVLTRRLDPMNQERLDLLTQLEREAGPAPLPCDRILSAMFVPALQLARDPERGGKNFLRLLGRAYADPAPFIRKFLAEQYATMIERFKAAFATGAPGSAEEGALVAPAFHHGRAVVHARGHRRAAAHRRAHAGGDRQRRGAAAAARPVPARRTAIAGARSRRSRAHGTARADATTADRTVSRRSHRCSPSSGSPPCSSARWCWPTSMPRGSRSPPRSPSRSASRGSRTRSPAGRRSC